MTEAGLAAIEAALGRFEAAHRAATDKGDGEAATAALREVRYWRTRRASAEVVKPPADKSKASFGMTVSLRRVDGREQSFRIVGEDEADPSRGTLSYVSPLARAVLTHRPGETVEMTGGEAVILDVRSSVLTKYCLMRKDRNDRGRELGANAYPEARIEDLSFSVVRKSGSVSGSVSTTTCTSPSSVKDSKLMKFGVPKVLGRFWEVECATQRNKCCDASRRYAP